MRKWRCASLVGFVVVIAVSAEAQTTIPDLARAKPSNPVVRGVLRDIAPLPLDILVKETPLIVVARLDWMRSYLTSDQMNILTDFRIVPDQIVAGRLPEPPKIPGLSTALTLTMYGGTLTIEGVTVTDVDHNIDVPRSGQQFLLFLSPYSKETGHYQIHNGAIFEINSQQIRTLFKQTSDVYKKDITDKPLAAAILDIRHAAGR